MNDHLDLFYVLQLISIILLYNYNLPGMSSPAEFLG